MNPAASIALQTPGVAFEAAGPAQAPAASAAPSDDARIAARVLAGENELFEQIVTRHERPVFALLLRMVKSREDAEDLAQTTFVTAFRRLDQYDQSREMRPWLYRIATNAALSHLRSKRPTEPLEDIEANGAQFADQRLESPRAAAQGAQLERRIADAIATFPPATQAIFHMRFRDQMSVESIAESLGKTANSVSVTLHRTRMALREMLDLSNDRGGDRS